MESMLNITGEELKRLPVAVSAHRGITEQARAREEHAIDISYAPPEGNFMPLSRLSFMVEEPTVCTQGRLELLILATMRASAPDGAVLWREPKVFRKSENFDTGKKYLVIAIRWWVQIFSYR